MQYVVMMHTLWKFTLIKFTDQMAFSNFLFDALKF